MNKIIFKNIIFALFVGGTLCLSANPIDLEKAKTVAQNYMNTIEVRASSLQAGMYLYSLLVDGRLVDTKRMILTE